MANGTTHPRVIPIDDVATDRASMSHRAFMRYIFRPIGPANRDIFDYNLAGGRSPNANRQARKWRAPATANGCTRGNEGPPGASRRTG